MPVEKSESESSRTADPEKIEAVYQEEVGQSRDLDTIETTGSGAFVWLVAVTASIAGGLFGYDTGIISAVLINLGTSLDGRVMNPSEKEAITSLCSGGAFFGAIAAGLTADKFGRKTSIYIGCALFTIGAVLQAASYSLAQMCVGRFIVGLGVGSAAMVAPLYIAEVAPTKYRGRMLGLNNVSITGGQLISYAIGAGLAHVPHGWRYMVGLGGVPSIVLACIFPFCPESPRQLVQKKRYDEARDVFRRIFKNATAEQIDDKVQLIRANIEEADRYMEGKTRFQLIKELHTVPRNFRALVVACGFMVISQMSGFNTLMYYSSTLFALVGFSNPTAVGLVVAGTNLLMTFINGMLVDPWGRRKTVISTAWGMSASLLAVAVAFHWIPVDAKTLAPQQSEVSTAAIVVLVFLILFIVSYALSVGNTAWMSTDFFAQDVRGMGTMFLTCSCWASNVIVSSTFLTQLHSMTPSGAFGFYAAICFTGWVLIVLFYPEVSGLSIDKTFEVFEQPTFKMVSYARKTRKERQAAGKLVTRSDHIPLGHQDQSTRTV